MTRQPIAYVFVGLPGCGKSTRAKEMVANDPNIHRINNDSYRIEIMKEKNLDKWDYESKTLEDMVSNRRTAAIYYCARHSQDLILDNLNLSRKTRAKTIKNLEKLGFQVEIVWFTDVPLEECIRRNAQRTGFDLIDEKVIRNFHAKYLKEANEKMPNFDCTANDLRQAIIVDIDGTLAEKGDRSAYDERRVGEDTVRWHVVKTVNALVDQQSCKLIIFSGRTDGCKEDTISWLHEKAGLYEFELHMRKKGDQRNDSIIKSELFNEHVKDKYNVVAVFDDRASVVRECWRPLGLPVFRCGLIDYDEF